MAEGYRHLPMEFWTDLLLLIAEGLELRRSYMAARLWSEAIAQASEVLLQRSKNEEILRVLSDEILAHAQLNQGQSNALRRWLQTFYQRPRNRQLRARRRAPPGQLPLREVPFGRQGSPGAVLDRSGPGKGGG